MIIDSSEGNKFRQYVKDKGIRLETCAVLGFGEQTMCGPSNKDIIY